MSHGGDDWKTTSRAAIGLFNLDVTGVRVRGNPRQRTVADDVVKRGVDTKKEAGGKGPPARLEVQRFLQSSGQLPVANERWARKITDRLPWSLAVYSPVGRAPCALASEIVCPSNAVSTRA